MYDGYLNFGGNEIGNNARTKGYATTADCPMFWYKGDVCAGVWDALGETVPYTYSNITEAPWFDSANAEVSSRFYGVWLVDVKGIQDSTRRASLYEGVGDGGTLGPTRKAAKEVRVKAVLIADGEDALGYGMAWLSAVLDPGACGQHGSGCGTADLAFWGSCPPTHAEVTNPLPVWAAPVVNLAVNPSFESPDNLPVGAVRTTYWSARGAYSLQVGFPGTGYGFGEGPFGGGLFGGSVPLSAEGYGLAPFGLTPFGLAIPSHVTVATLTNQTFLITPKETGQVVLLDGVATVTQALVPIRLYGSGVVELGTGYWDEMLVVDGEYLGSYFDGDNASTPIGTTPGQTIHRYAWTGEPHASTSTWEQGVVTVVEDPVAWEARVLDLRRYLHDVGAVSGPLVTEEFESGRFFGNVVEFTFVAERPWVYKALKPLDLPPTTPVVVQDIPYNLAPYPSAELSSGSVIVARNYAPNPSVEVDASGWVTWYNGNIPAVMKAAGRGTSLVSHGTWSYLAHIFGDNGATSVVNRASDVTNLQEPIPLTGLAAGTRVSFSIWGAMAILEGAGGSELTNMEASVHWLNSSDAIVGSYLLGGPVTGADVNGHVFAAKSLLPPAGATKARVAVTYRFTFSSSTNPANDSDIRLYADALAITVP